MGFNLGAVASFGTGAFNAEDQMQQLAFQKQQQRQQLEQGKMSLLMNGMKLQDEQRNMKYSQDESEYARQLATDPDTMDLPVDQRMDLMAKKAMSSGDLVRANELAVNATNFRNTQVQQAYKQQQTASKMMDSQQKLHNYMGSELAAAAEGGEGDFNRAKMMALQSGEGTPQDQAKLADLKWDSDLARRLRLGSMTSRQQAQTLNDQSKLVLDEKNKDNLQRARELRQQLNERKVQDKEELDAAKAKSGGGIKAPTKEEMDQASTIVVKTGIDPKSPEFEQVQQSIVSTAKQIQRTNPNIGTAQAMQQAADRIAKQDIKVTTIPSMFGDTKKTEYKMEGATPKAPIEFTGDVSSLIPGRYYRKGGQVYQFTGTGMLPVQ